MLFRKKTSSKPARKPTRTKAIVGRATTQRTNWFSGRRAIAFGVSFAVIGTIAAILVFAAISQPDEADQISRINNYRSGRGLNTLTTSGCLTNAARAWSQHMSSAGVIHHSNGSDGKGNTVHDGDPGLRGLVNAHCPDQWSVSLAENVGVGGSSEALFKAFIESPGHEKNIVMQANMVAVGVFKDDRGVLWVTQLFTTCDANCGPEWYQGVAPSQNSSATTVQNGIGTAVRSDGGSWVVDAAGKVSAYAPAKHLGDMGGQALNKPIVGMAATPSGNGYWLVASDGGMFTFGDAPFHGSTGGMSLNSPIVGMAVHPNGQGYWLVASDGGIFSFGSVGFFGSMGGQALNKPIIGMASSPSGNGYWLYAADGGMFTFGDAGFYGSTGGMTLSQPIIAMAPHPSNGGYWLVAKDGGIFAFGNAGFYGSAGDSSLTKPIIGIMVAADGNGYSLIQSDGTAISYGSAQKVYGQVVYRNPELIPVLLEGESFNGNCATKNIADGGASGGQVKYMDPESAWTPGCYLADPPLANTAHNGSIGSLNIRYRCYEGYDNSIVVVKIDGTVVINSQPECRNGFIVVNRSGLNFSQAAHSIEVRNQGYAFMLFDYLEITAVPYTNNPPTVPGNLRITSDSGTGKIGLVWDASSDNKGVTEYRILRNGNLLAFTSQTTFTDTSVVNDTAYSYQVTAIDTEGAESGMSNTASFTTPYVNTPPSAPTNLKTTSLTRTLVALSWGASIDNKGIKEYRVFRNGSQIGVTTTTSYNDSTIRKGAKYTYEVIAVDTEGSSSSKSVSLAVTVPRR